MQPNLNFCIPGKSYCSTLPKNPRRRSKLLVLSAFSDQSLNLVN